MEGPLAPALIPPGTQLIETLAWDGAAPVRGEAHLARMAGSARAFGWPFDPGAARAALVAGLGPEPRRLRLAMGADGGFDRSDGPLPAPIPLWRVAVHPERLDAADPWLRHKSTRRDLYDRARAALPPDLEEWLFFNGSDEVCEGTITNLLFDRGDGWRTPPLASGCLPGILRAEALGQGVREEPLAAADLPRVRLRLGNALRGWRDATLVP